MKKETHYLVTFFSYEEADRRTDFAERLRELCTPWAAEYNAGLFFISSPLSAGEIEGALRAGFEEDVVYVLELGGSFAGGGSSKSVLALSERLKLSSQT